MKSTYELKRFKDSKSIGILAALNLYTEYTEPAIRTDTKEILHCLDNWNRLFEDPFYVVGFYYNGQLIGFSELAYFRKEKFVIVDYLVIHKNYRKNNTFYQFLDDLKFFLAEEQFDYTYIVAEVACYHEKFEPPESSKLLIRLLKMSHFGVVKCNYYVPRVGMNDFESSMRSIMMIYSLNQTNQIKKDTFLQIVNAIYVKYYQRWHNIFADHKEIQTYDAEIIALKEKIIRQIGDKEIIEINGLTGLFPVQTEFSGDTKAKKLVKVVTVLSLFMASMFLIGGIFSLLKSKLGWDSEASSSSIAFAAGLTVFLVAIIFDKNSNVFSRLVEKIFEKL